MAFPSDPLDLDCELYLGSTWTSVKSYVYQRSGAQPPVSLQRGRQNESSQANPGRASWQWNNRDGRFSPKNPLSPYYGQLGRNTPVRFSIPAQTSYLRFETDNASTVSTPSSSALNVPGDLEIQIDAKVTFSEAGQAIPLLLKWGSGGEFSWYAEVATSGRVNFWRSTDGSATALVTSTMPLPPGRTAVKITYASAAGTVTWYTAASISGTWTQLGDAVSFGSGGTLYASTAAVQIGNASDPGLTGAVYAAKVLSGIGGTAVASPDFTVATAGASSVTDAQGNVWTLNGTAEISSRDYRFHGEMSSQPPKWDVTGNDMAVKAQAGGPLRRIGQGQAPPVMSPMKRALLSSSGSLYPVAYWPCEDAAAATSLGSATGGPLMSVTGSSQLASDSTFLCSSALPQLNGSIWRGQVPSYTSNGSIVVRFLLKLGTIPSGNRDLVTLYTSGTCQAVAVRVYSTSGLGLYGVNGSGSVFDSGEFSFTNMPAAVWMSIELRPGSSGTVDYALVALVPGSTTGQEFTGSFSGTIGNVSTVVADSSAAFTDTVIGHVSVQSDWESMFGLYQPLNAWQGEAAASRFARLAGENGYQARVIGAPGVSAAMGAQAVDTLNNLLQQCEDADRGQIFEPRQCLGLGYRTLASMCNQAAAVTLDYSLSEPGGAGGSTDSGLDPQYDDQLTRNDWTLTRGSGSGSSGATYRYQLDDGSPMSISDPPTGAGDYGDSKTVYVQADSQLPDVAGWMVHAGTVDEARWPVIPINLARSQIISGSLYYPVADADIGDFAELANIPDLVTYDPVKQLIYGTAEALGGFHHTIAWNAVPESPYEVIILDDAVYGRVDTDGSAVTVPGVSASATSLPVQGYQWTTAVGDFPFDIAVSGERMTVTAVAAAAHPGCRVGTTLSDTGMGLASWSAASSAWQGWTGSAPGCARVYLSGSGSWSISTDMSAMIAAGVKMLISLHPGYDPVSSSDLAAIGTFMQALQTAGAVCDIAIWHEPYYSGLSAAQYIAAVEYYGPVIRQYYPLVFVTSTSSFLYHAENTYYPGDAYVDKVAADLYPINISADTADYQLAQVAAIADGAPKPLGIWELGVSTASTVSSWQTQAYGTDFVQAAQSYMAQRLASGLPNADVCWFSGAPGESWLGCGTTAEAGFEGGSLGNWTGAGNSTIAASSAQAHSGTYSMAVTATASGNAQAASCAGGSIAAQGMPCAAGDTIDAAAWFRAAATARSVQVGVQFYTSAGASISSSYGAVTPADTVTGWTQAVCTGVTAPASAAYARLLVQVLSAAASEVHYVDDCELRDVAGANAENVTTVEFGWDYRIALWEALYTALDSTSYPQVMTVTRAVNGVSKAQSAGADVRLWFPPILALT